MMADPLEEQLCKIIKQQEWLMEALREVRKLNLPDWYIAVGAVRNTVWNYLHNYPTTINQNDVDVVYFDCLDMRGKREKIFEKSLRKNLPDLKWEVVNQARAHLFNRGPGITRPAVNSSCESISYWSETPTCVGVRLEDDDSLTICAPHGLNDLMSMIVRPAPFPYQELPLYRKRRNEKKWHNIWPMLKVEEV